MGAKALESPGIHPEHEIIREDRIIVLQGGSYFALPFSFKVKLDRLKAGKLGLREKLIKIAESEETGQ